MTQQHNEKEEGRDDELYQQAEGTNALGIETILKAGEVLYIPSHWFHYIIGLQKNIQCNVRNGGVDIIGTTKFGGQKDITNEYCGK